MTGAELHAQALGVHPTVAPIAPAVPSTFKRGVGSPLFNWQADGIWNNGEGFPAGAFAPDHGGYRDGDHANVQRGDIHPYLDAAGNGGWQPFAGSTTVNHFVGYLRPASIGPIANGGQVEDAAFEVFVPAQRDHSQPLVVIVGLWSTKGVAILNPATDDDGTYPGHARPDGLYALSGGGAVERPLDGAYVVDHAPTGFDVAFAYIVPRTFGRPMVFQMQRAIQLAKAVDLMFSDPTGRLLPPNFIASSSYHALTPKVATGGSFGGLTSQVAALRHADIFHGAVGQAFSGSVRRVPGEQWMLNYIGRGTGMHRDETSFNPRDALEWGFYLRQVGWDYFNASTTYRIRHNQVPRPIALQIADQDTVTSGVDWLPFFSGIRGHDPQGVTLVGTPLGGTTKVAWSVVDKRCHGEAGPLTTPLLGVPGALIPDAALEMVPEAYASFVSDPGSAASIPPTVTDDGSEAPYEHALARGRFQPPPLSAYTVLEPDPAFGQQVGPNGVGRTVGQGLGLGIEESLKSYRIHGDDDDSLFVGSFDGVVTRYLRDATTNELVPQAASEPLGHGAWALDVGKIPGLQSDPVVVVGTQRAIHVLDARTLSTLAPGPYALDFEHELPRRLRIAKIHATGNDRDIVFLTFHGHLMVLDDDLATLRTDLGEPGIQDFEIHESLAGDYGHATTSSKVPVTLLSHRRHLFNVTLEDQSSDWSLPPAELHAWTDYQIGEPKDLEVYDDPGTGDRMVAATFESDGGATDQIRVFEAKTLVQPTVPGYGASALESLGKLMDLTCVRDAQGDHIGFVVLNNDRIWWVPFQPGSAVQMSFLSRLGGFAPSFGPTALHMADIGPSVGGEPQEIAISTLSGHVLWLPVSSVRTPTTLSLSLPRPLNPGGSVQHFPNTNRTLSGTWGMLSRMVVLQNEFLLHRLYVADQCGELFEVDPQNGQVSWLADMRNLFETATGGGQVLLDVAVAPVRDLALLGEDVSASNTQPFYRQFLSPSVPVPGARWLKTRPWQNLVDQPFGTVWYRNPPPGSGNEPDPDLPIYFGLAPFVNGGTVSGLGISDPTEVKRHLHWWGGRYDTFANLVQGVYVSATEVKDSWFSTKDTGATGIYGPNRTECKDLRNLVRNDNGSTYNLQSIRAGVDGAGPVLALTTTGGTVTLLRPGMNAALGTSADSDFGELAWDGGQFGIDDGFGGLALATRKVPGQPGLMDIFAGTCMTYPDPAVVPIAGAAQMVGMVRWMRWDGTTMQQMGAPVPLDANAATSYRGGFGVAGLAVGDAVQSPQYPGAELVVTTLAGDLFVFSLGSAAIGAQIQHVWVPGSLGAYNSILIEDLDFDFKNEVYVAGSQGLWKWRQK